jgi:hypothetical protein
VKRLKMQILPLAMVLVGHLPALGGYEQAIADLKALKGVAGGWGNHGGWLLVTGYWLLVAGCWLLAIGGW